VKFKLESPPPVKRFFVTKRKLASRDKARLAAFALLSSDRSNHEATPPLQRDWAYRDARLQTDLQDISIILPLPHQNSTTTRERLWARIRLCSSYMDSPNPKRKPGRLRLVPKDLPTGYLVSDILNTAGKASFPIGGCLSNGISSAILGTYYLSTPTCHQSSGFPWRAALHLFVQCRTNTS
jgi:hypothetical protein